MATKQAQDFTAVFKDMMGAMPMDMGAFEGAFKNASSLNEKMTAVALNAAEKSTEISSKWTKATIERMQNVAKAEPTDYAKAMTAFASAQAEVNAENMAAFAEVAKKVQMETVELFMNTGKQMSEEAQAAMEKAGKDMSSAAKKATAAAK